jgi:hypothetical protein
VESSPLLSITLFTMIVFLLVASAVLCEASFNFLAVDNTTIQALGLSSGCITALYEQLRLLSLLTGD